MLCQKYKVKALFAFGSVTKNNLKPDSDIDLVVDFDLSDPIEYADNYFELKNELKGIFKREIDLLEQKALRNPFLIREINETKILVYGG